MDDAVCATTDPELFFPEKGKSAVDARRICERCPVIDDCLEFAIVNRYWDGIYGGTNGKERQAMVKARRRKAVL
jgi:WhiB family redox-sensing transcriptional regulator